VNYYLQKFLLARYEIFIRIKIQLLLKEVTLGNGHHVSKHYLREVRF